MAVIEEALVARLEGFAGFAALCSSRVYPLILPEAPTLPAVTYQRIDTIREETHDGPSGLAHPRIQFTTWSETSPAQAHAVADQIRFALHGFVGTVSGVEIQAVHHLLERDDYDELTQRFKVIQDFRPWHAEPTE